MLIITVYYVEYQILTQLVLKNFRRDYNPKIKSLIMKNLERLLTQQIKVQQKDSMMNLKLLILFLIQLQIIEFKLIMQRTDKLNQNNLVSYQESMLVLLI
ncbi:unnamed protein product [Paramecium pentaurelia]|uniref:Uncharacterized protein n=1 Tax=Paramecium pentaurelia TaxID=43138 RepID=A0A8S1WXQ8_9CILI|nr:unnamed protein product [Paramecium pentaurelia]